MKIIICQVLMLLLAATCVRCSSHDAAQQTNDDASSDGSPPASPYDGVLHSNNSLDPLLEQHLEACDAATAPGEPKYR